MARETIDTIAKYLVVLVTVGSCFYIIATAPAGADLVQPWSIITLVIGWIIRDSAGNTSSANLARVAAAQPTVTTTSGPPATTTIGPSEAGA